MHTKAKPLRGSGQEEEGGGRPSLRWHIRDFTGYSRLHVTWPVLALRWPFCTLRWPTRALRWPIRALRCPVHAFAVLFAPTLACLHIRWPVCNLRLCWPALALPWPFCA